MNEIGDHTDHASNIQHTPFVDDHRIANLQARLPLGAARDQSTDSNAKRRPIVGRVGETGFAALCGDFTNWEELHRFAEAMPQHSTAKLAGGSREFSLTSRMGAARYPDNDLDGGGSPAKAKIALQQAGKIAMPPRFYSAEMVGRSVNRTRVAKELSRAVDNGDLYLVYQPKVDAGNGNLIGVEALLRWRSPDHGAVLPGEFIPLAEESDLILAIGEYVLYEACRQSRRWSDAGCRVIPIAVNFSGRQFDQPDLVRRTQDTLDTHSVGYEHIEVELTESVAVENSAQVQVILGELKELGIRTAIDDFGTGYSSLGSLGRFQFHTLKIDRSFVSTLNRAPRAGSIVKGMINIGHALGMQVVAEGVEEEHQLEFLRNQNCDAIQGYLTGRPVSADSIQTLLR